ncbi:MAG TPA: AAA family ATPase [Anaeromyxobacter sp.]|nr:AAA family ATPase [Anaeromyxobacter sp.]
MIEQIEIEGFRSVRSVRMRMKPVLVVVGENGTGKTNLYRALQLFHAAASGNLARTIAEDGGMESVLWAGARKRGPVRMRIAARMDDFSYELELGLPDRTVGQASAFDMDPVVKRERVLLDGAVIVDRRAQSVTLRDVDGRPVTHAFDLWSSESVLARVSEPQRYPALSALRDRFLTWRFYHSFRTDPDSPIRRSQVPVRTPALAPDGRDLACALQTIHEVGDAEGLRAAIDRAFPGSELELGGREVKMQTPGLHRPLDAHELSDGTLRYLCLIAALLSPRLPPLLALNEPETSLHPDLLDPLAELIAGTPRGHHVWLTTHAQELAERVARRTGAEPVRLTKEKGETRVVGQGLVDVEDED